MYRTFFAEGGPASALFEVVQRRYLKGSIILTTNWSIASWGQIFDDPMIAAAMLDRLLRLRAGASPSSKCHRSSLRGQLQRLYVSGRSARSS